MEHEYNGSNRSQWDLQYVFLVLWWQQKSMCRDDLLMYGAYIFLTFNPNKNWLHSVTLYSTYFHDLWQSASKKLCTINFKVENTEETLLCVSSSGLPAATSPASLKLNATLQSTTKFSIIDREVLGGEGGGDSWGSALWKKLSICFFNRDKTC